MGNIFQYRSLDTSVNFKNLGHTTENTIFRLVKLSADLSTNEDQSNL